MTLKRFLLQAAMVAFAVLVLHVPLFYMVALWGGLVILEMTVNFFLGMKQKIDEIHTRLIAGD